jgi:hypothetical protein
VNANNAQLASLSDDAELRIMVLRRNHDDAKAARIAPSSEPETTVAVPWN